MKLCMSVVSHIQRIVRTLRKKAEVEYVLIHAPKFVSGFTKLYIHVMTRKCI